MEAILFLFFSSLTLTCGLFVITSKNPIHSVLFLVLVFFNVSGLLILLGVEFLAFLFLIVYVGAIAVLFLFIVMMLSIKIPEYKLIIYRYIPIGVILGTGFLCEILIVFESELSSLIVSPFGKLTFNTFYLNSITLWDVNVVPITNIEVFAGVLYTHYAYFFIIAGIILLVSMIGAITLTLHRRIDIKRQKIYKQVQKEFAKTIIWTSK
ncbi:NADH dehydrogenase subunit 6 (mitochondrion) [Hemiselmis andersenii]|uniref:NADH-ubiquinone oxidoreductase chain 6 n=1 Tax=Hemiselmis andersenii TaxID=464988 RepID=B2MWU7_HEMAN|nr:NADH dehydrogenase subunit 6 [Hemiselmis andersenii]ACC78239.1 NADH dehydrogenase subunit 6 [Hemiselmis andersenii]